jgi:phospholipid/cholesterol/gamma-HCH transport system ATP-binding protein
VIRVHNLRIAFGGKTIIDGIDLEVPEGGVLALMGKNGSGKSVILKALSGLIDYQGTIELNGIDIRELYRDRFNIASGATKRFRVAYVFQKGGLFDSMDVFDNVAFGLKRLGADDETIEKAVLASLARVGLRGNERKLPSELSGGMQKRVGLARALCFNPNIIFFDDPTAGLDPILTDSIADLLLEIKNSLKTTAILATHDNRAAQKVADSIALIYQGKIVYYGDVAGFYSEANDYTRQFIEGEIEGPIDIF